MSCAGGQSGRPVGSQGGLGREGGTTLNSLKEKSLIGRRIAVAALAIALAVSGNLWVTAGPAKAATCNASLTWSRPDDYATNIAFSGCSMVSVRHLYDPVWSSTNYWTSWDYDVSWASSTPTAELIRGQGGEW